MAEVGDRKMKVLDVVGGIVEEVEFEVNKGSLGVWVHGGCLRVVRVNLFIRRI